MQIYDLTQGKYLITDAFMGIRLDSYVFDAIRSWYGPFNKSFLFNSHSAGTMRQKLHCFLQEVPIFLVDTSMSGIEYIIPDTGVKISIPLDNYESLTHKEEEDLDFFRKLMERDNHEDVDKLDKKGGLVHVISDYLGVYIASSEQDTIPARIFIWVDKVCKCTRGKNLRRALLEQIILHEYGHALMDIELYGFGHTPLFSYADYPYRFMEEMCANAFSIHCGWHNWKQNQRTFIEKFVKSQPKEYAAGWNLVNFHHHIFLEEGVMEFWMWAKVYLNKDIVSFLDWFWNSKDYETFAMHSHHSTDIPRYLSSSHAKEMLVKSCGKEFWMYGNLSNKKFGIVRLGRKTRYVTDAKYDFAWSFDENDLCMVSIDQPKGYHYGFVNTSGIEQISVKYDDIYSFENGVTIAKNNGQYCIIDENDNVVIGFGNKYTKIGDFKNGYAAVQNTKSQWGIIDKKGNTIIPCRNVVFINYETSLQVRGKVFKFDIHGHQEK